MKKSRIVRYLAYVTFILILFCVLPGGSLATRDSSGHGNGVQYAGENITDSVTDIGSEKDPENYKKNNVEGANGTDNSYSENMQDQDGILTKDQDRISAYKFERKQIQEKLQLQKEEYREAKGDFLKVRNQIKAGNLDPNSEEAVNATRLYLNSSISYMVIHLENVKTNMQYSNGNGTEERIAAIDENIKLLEAEQAEVASASSQQEFAIAVRSVRGVWDNAQKISLTSAGQTVSQKVGEFLDKSGKLSEKLEADIESLNETGVNTAQLATRLASYNLYIKAAHEKKEAADSIYEDENSTRENLKVANNYLRESLNNVNKANQILRVIFDELKKYNLEEVNEIGVKNSIETELNNTISINNTNNNLSV
ncbi:chromosome segregation ATPase [Methanosarcina sp. DH2]|uniref:chromosome segregation ATPase n=1 Tax=Methanosarcina sp. DH2 TaxID=2605639 RepID=UPI001E55FC41|nr:chromosome segregation ATPase [Methanosarcina sp. DH2]MCC4771816.1 chromosome segregation ATPase [Methanosarcina sp. DH2]